MVGSLKAIARLGAALPLLWAARGYTAQLSDALPSAMVDVVEACPAEVGACLQVSLSLSRARARARSRSRSLALSLSLSV